MRNIFHGKFPNLSSKLKSDKNSDCDAFVLPPYTDSLYISSKNEKEIFSELYKKMSSVCVINYAVSDDKKLKKTFWESLSGLLCDSQKKLLDDPFTKEIMDNSIYTFDEMARNTKEFEKTLSVNVIKHFHDLSEDNTLGITKKALTSLSKDIKTNSEKVQQLQDQINNQPLENLSFRKTAEVGGTASAENKLVSAQTIAENNLKEWENKKDLYLTKLFGAEAQKITTAEKLLEFFQDYYNYFTECQKTLAKCIPEIKASIDSHKQVYAFHLLLEDHLCATNRKLSYVLETCIQELDNEETLQHEGLFRISGGKTKMELLKGALNVMRVDDFITKGCNSAVYAGVLKQYLRELPNPLMTFELYDHWCEVGNMIRQNDSDGAMTLIKGCLSIMPSCYYDNLAYLMQFLRKILAYESINKMSASNLALMLGPNLIRNKQACEGEDSETSAMMMLGSPGGTVLEFMITHFHELFPDAPVYITVPKIAIKVSDTSSAISANEKESDKTTKKLKPINDDDCVSSGDVKLDDYSSTTTLDYSDGSNKLQRDLTSGRQRSFRKAHAPPPPPQVKPYSVVSDSDTVKETIALRPDNRPTVRKRVSKLDPMISDSSRKDVEVPNEYSSVVPISRPTQNPPSKKSEVSLELDTVDRPMKLDNYPPKRPNIPPPPIPPFVKLKQNLDIKETPDHGRKQSLHDESSSVSLHQDSSASFKTKTHHYSSSDGPHTAF